MHQFPKSQVKHYNTTYKDDVSVIPDGVVSQLVIAICKRAAKDITGSHIRRADREDARRFFLHGDFEALTGMDGEAIYKRLLDERKE